MSGSPPARRLGVVGWATIVGAAIVALAGARTGCELAFERPYLGVRFGMRAPEVRAALTIAPDGVFLVGTEQGEPTLRWHRGSGMSGPTAVESIHFGFRDLELHRLDIVVQAPPEATRALLGLPSSAVTRTTFEDGWVQGTLQPMGQRTRVILTR